MAKISLMPETGESGLQHWMGQVMEAYTSKLHWPGAFSIYDEMRRRDPSIRTIWNALILFARTASWYAEPGGPTDGDKRAAEFLQSAIEDMSHTIEDAIEDALSCVLFGWSWDEIVYKRRADGLIGWKKWAVRRQSSFEKWEFDKAGGVQALVQRPAPDYEEIAIPIGKSLHFTSQRDGGNPEGFALLESLYEIWYYVKNYQIIQGIGWERSFVGLPVFEYEETPTAEDKAVVEATGKGLRVDEKQFLSVPKGMKFRLETTSNQGAEALLNTIKHYRLLMLQTLLADFIDLGTGQTGSWALGSDKSQLFLMAVDGFLDRIVGVINRFGVPRLIEFNTTLGATALPRLVHTPVEKPALGQLGNWLQQVGDRLQWRPEDEDWLRRRVGMPALRVEEKKTQETQETQRRGDGEAQETQRRGDGEAQREEGVEGRGEDELAELAEGGRDGERAEIEASLAGRIAAFLRGQKRRVIEAAGLGANPGADEAFWAEEESQLKQSFLQQILRAVLDLAQLVIQDTTDAIGGGADWALVNADAAAWARTYVGQLITAITSTTKRAVRETVATWIETGAALPDLTKALAPTFGRSRAELIASTEVTRAFDEANDLVRQHVGLPRAAFKAPAHPRCRCYTRPTLLPNGEWVVVWSTVRDDRVCQRPVDTPWGRVNGCRRLHGVITSDNYLGRKLGDVRAEVRK